MTTYIEDLKGAIEDIRCRTLAGKLPLEQRIIEVKKASDKYALEHARANDKARYIEAKASERENREPRELPFNPPDSALLDQLANLILHEDLTDSTAWKTRQSEYPFLSEIQLARRRDGVHQRKNEGGSGEVRINAAKYRATDGLDHRKPYRKIRSTAENILIDEEKRSRNVERRRKYEEFTKIQPVTTYKIT